MVGLKIDVDTDRGTAIGVPALSRFLKQRGIKATFLFSLGPDHTGWALKRIFRPGFFKKVQRTSVLKVYGLKTLLNGILWPGPHIGNRHKDLMKHVQGDGHEVGIHAYDHVYWQDNVHKMTEPQIRYELNKAQAVFKEIFGHSAHTIGAPGWQINEKALMAYDDYGFLYASDTRGDGPFYPKVGHHTYKTLQIPTSLPTLDECIGLVPDDQLLDLYWQLIEHMQCPVLTAHAELEGMAYFEWFQNFIDQGITKGINWTCLENIAQSFLRNPAQIPVKSLAQITVEGRSGEVAGFD